MTENHWDELRDRGIDVDLGGCMLCKTLEADRVETVQHEKTGEEMSVELCEECWHKTLDYHAGEDVSFEDELRLRESKS